MTAGTPVDNVVPLRAADVPSQFATSPYKTEKLLCDDVEANIRPLCRDLGYDDILGYEREHPLSGLRPRGSVPRVDFRIEVAAGHYALIECKNPTNTSRELLSAVGQILDYALQCEMDGVHVVDCWLLTTKLDLACLHVIYRFRLPISICVWGEKDFAIWKNYAGNKLE